MATWSKLEEIDSANMADLNTTEVSGGSLEIAVIVSVDDQRSLSEGESAVLHLSNTSSGSLGSSNASQIVLGTDLVEVLEKSFGGLTIEAVNNERKLWDGVNSVSSGLNKWGACGGGKSGADGVSLLVEVNLSLPFSPDLEWGKHATLTALVTESTLAGPVSTRT